MTKNAMNKGKVEEKQLKSMTRKEEKGFKELLKDEEGKYTA